jgi:hypothetical protein
MPLTDVQYAYHVQSCAFILAHDNELRLVLVARFRGSRGVRTVVLVLVLLEVLVYRRVKDLLTRSPDAGSTKVAARNYPNLLVHSLVI